MVVGTDGIPELGSVAARLQASPAPDSHCVDVRKDSHLLPVVMLFLGRKMKRKTKDQKNTTFWTCRRVCLQPITASQAGTCGGDAPSPSISPDLSRQRSDNQSLTNSSRRNDVFAGQVLLKQD